MPHTPRTPAIQTVRERGFRPWVARGGAGAALVPASACGWAVERGLRSVRPDGGWVGAWGGCWAGVDGGWGGARGAPCAISA
jgi:hypothetical protein